MIQIWENGNMIATRFIAGSVHYLCGMFVTTNNDVYVSNSAENRVDIWFSNASISLPAMLVHGNCYSLFIDSNNTLYCCVGDLSFVVSMPINDTTNTIKLIAGQGCAGSESDMLSSPRGVFVDFHFDLYVADCGNNRIQKFQSGQRNGTTVAGCGASGTMNLSGPTGVVLDADGYIFIVDTGNNRIVGSGANGFRCVAGCSGGISFSRTASYELNGPRTMAFDSYGNIWVADYENKRVQKFLLENSSYGKPTIIFFSMHRFFIEIY